MTAPRPDTLPALTAEAQRMVEEARARFQRDVDATLATAQRLAEVFAQAIGEVSSDQALDAWRHACITALRTDQSGGL